MPSQDPNQEQPDEQKADQTLAQKVKVLQERVRKLGVVSDGSNDKALMDEAWGENSGTLDRRPSRSPSGEAVFRRGTNCM